MKLKIKELQLESNSKNSNNLIIIALVVIVLLLAYMVAHHDNQSDLHEVLGHLTKVLKNL